MRLYSGPAGQFIKDCMQDIVAHKLKEQFFGYFGFNPSHNEFQSWRNSLRAMSQVIQYAELGNTGVILEYQLPQSSRRLDCILGGYDAAGRSNAIIVELKQWDECSESDGENEVETWVGGARRDVLHPSAQVDQYRQYLSDTHTAFYDQKDPIRLKSCAYLHNYHFKDSDPLLDAKFSNLLLSSPSFAGDQVDELAAYLSESVPTGDGLAICDRIERGEHKPSKQLLSYVSEVIDGEPKFTLIDDQLVVFDKIRALAKRGTARKKKSCLIIRGGPGTGKSVVAINIMGAMLKDGLNAHYATGSKAFTETLRKIIGTRGSTQFKYFNSYMQAAKDEVDVLVCDEAHRLRETSNNRFTPKAKRSGLKQIQELLHTAKVSVFFIDDDQVVRPGEVGSVELIRNAAKENGCEIFDFELEAQFRCGGSDGFINWVNNTLGIRDTANPIWTGEEGFDFKVLGSPEEIEEELRNRISEGATARMTAGFCWPWSKPNSDGALVEDVIVGDYRRPWNAKPDAGRLARGIPKASLWANDPNGFDQVGCVYTAQGFEFEYAGVIWGKDLIYDLDAGHWVGNKEHSFDTVVKRSGDRFLELVKNTYRVLLTRGLKGCYVYFEDKDTERFVRSRMKL